MKNFTFLSVILLLLSLNFIAVAGAPNSGDGYPDGSGWDEFNPIPGEINGKGPAPNSGDGIPDGSGF